MTMSSAGLVRVSRLRLGAMKNCASIAHSSYGKTLISPFCTIINQIQCAVCSGNGDIQNISTITPPQTQRQPCHMNPLSKQSISSRGPVSYNFRRNLTTGYQKQPQTNKKDQIQERDTSTLLETWFYEVSPYGSLHAQLPFNTVVTPLNPIDYPDMNKCIIELFYKTNDSSSETKLPNPHQLSQISEMYTLDVFFDKDQARMNLSCAVIQGVTVPVQCHLRVPLKFDLSLKMSGNENITVESMESNSINIEADRGDVNLKKIKSGSISALSKSGNITSKSTQLGSSHLHCGGSGSISADKLQGSSMTCTTEMGSLDVKSLYTENATFKTVTGDVHLGQSHGQVHVVGEKTNLHIESQEGDLDVCIHQGSVNIHLSRHNRVDVDLNQGDVNLSFPEGAATDLNLNGPSVVVADDVLAKFHDTDIPHHKDGHVGEPGQAQVNVRTLSGKISLQVLSWIESTKLAMLKKREEC